MKIDITALKTALKSKAAQGGYEMTLLCAFRAHLRGRQHFSPTTNLALRYFIDGVPVPKTLDEKSPDGYRWSPITAEVVEQWCRDHGLYSLYEMEPTETVEG